VVIKSETEPQKKLIESGIITYLSARAGSSDDLDVLIEDEEYRFENRSDLFIGFTVTALICSGDDEQIVVPNTPPNVEEADW